MIMMKCKKKTLFFLITGVFISAAVVATIFFIPPLRKQLEQTDESEEDDPTPKPPVAKRTSKGGVCATEDCVIAAAKILKHMETGADPCRDFYNYACGKFLRSNSIPEGWDSYGIEDIENEELDVSVKSVLEESDKINQSDALNKSKAIYNMCMDAAYIDEYGISDLKEVLSKTGIGEWPFLNSEWNDCRLDIEWRMSKLNSMGLDSLFRLETKFSGEDYKLHAVIRPGEPLVDHICDDDPDNMTIVLERALEHREILVSVLELLGVEVDNVTDIDIDELFEFDFLFCNATKESRLKDPVEDLETLKTTLGNLDDIAPEINWIRWRNLIFSELHLDFPHDKQHIYVDILHSALRRISELLSKTSSKVQANYLTWRFVLQHLGFLGKDFRQILESNSHLLSHKMGNYVMNSDHWTPRWRQCVMYVKNLMPLSILQDYGDYIQMKEREKEMDILTSLITDEFKMVMKDVKYFSPVEQMRSIHKISLIQFLLTYPYKHSKFFNDYYTDFTIMNDSFLKNGLRLRLSRMRKLMEGVSRGKTVYDMEYAIQTIYSAFGSNTYSFFRGNQIVISLGTLQSSPLEEKPLPKFLTLPTIGFRIGHELAHGFDLYAMDGASGQNWTWWSPSIFKAAESQAKCYYQFYSLGNDTNIRKALKMTTLNEDLCDSQSFALTHRAYLRYLSQSNDDQSMAGLVGLTNMELFYISYAQQFCELRRTEDPTTISGRRRVNQVLRNYGPFSLTFGCPREKPMNDHKCTSLWA